MKDRIAELIENEGLSPSRFADIIEVQRSNISHILAGRNKPSLDFLQKIMQHFPSISGDWLLAGIGSMYKSSNGETMGNTGMADQNELFSTSGAKVQEDKTEPKHMKEQHVPKQSLKVETDSKRRIKKIVVLYSDFSMDEFVLDRHLE